MIFHRRFSFHDRNLGCFRRHMIYVIQASWSWVTRPGRQDPTFGTGRCATASGEQTTGVANTSGPVDQMHAHSRHGTPLSLCRRSQSCSCILHTINEIFTRSTWNRSLVGIIPAPSIFKAAGALRGFTVSSRCILPSAAANLFAPATPIYQTHLAIYHLQANPVNQVAGFSLHSTTALLIE